MSFDKNNLDNKSANYTNGEHLPIDKSIQLSNELFDELLKTNDIENVLQTIESFAHKSLYHHYLKALVILFISALTLDKSDLKNANKVVEELTKLSNKYRRHGFLNNVMKLVKTPNYNKYTDLETHAELIHSFNLFLSGLVCGLDTYNVYGLIKVAFRFQKFMQTFKICLVILETKTNWESDCSKLTFEAGVRLSNGLSNLAISNIPPILLRIINFLGFSGEERIAFEELNKVAFHLPGIFSQFARLFLIDYALYLKPHSGLESNDLSDCIQVLNKELERYPKSLLYLTFKAKLEQISGRIDNAINIYKGLVKDYNTIAQIVFQIELMFCYALKCEWNECIVFAELTRKKSEHSPAYTTYCEAVFRYVKGLDESNDNERQKATKLFEIVPTLRIRNFPKTITMEKVSVLISDKYFKMNEFLILPELEMLYYWNYLSFIRGDQILLTKFMDRVDKQIDIFKDDLKISDYLDNYLTALFYKGVIHKLLGNFSEAKECLNSVFISEARIGREYSIPPQAVLELGLIELALHNREEAKKWLNKCIDDYSGYTNENYVHLRAFAGLREMGVNTEQQKANESKLEEYRKQWLKDINIEENKYESIVEKEEQNELK